MYDVGTRELEKSRVGEDDKIRGSTFDDKNSGDHYHDNFSVKHAYEIAPQCQTHVTKRERVGKRSVKYKLCL